MNRVTQLTVHSRVLRKNPLGDPHERPVLVFQPETHKPLPVIFMLAGFTGSGQSFLNYDFGSESMPARLTRLIGQGMPPALFVFVDAMTRYGGSQYLDSPATGRYATHIARELVPFIDAQFRTTGLRALAGKSSGGYGALRLAMDYPELFHAAASHSGDAHFALCYASDFIPACRVLHRYRRRNGSADTARFFAEWEAMDKKPGHLFPALELMAMSAAYSPKRGPVGANFDLPVDLDTGLRRDKVFARWLANDPLVMLEQRRVQKALGSLRALHIECGTRDEYALDFGARLLSRRLRALDIAHTHEEFDDGHRNVTYRYDVSLPRLVKALVKKT